MTPEISVILCTYNPRPDLLAWALSSLERQTLPAGRFEVIVVDNHSTPPVADQALIPGARLVRETRQGLTYARVAGIRASLAPVIIFLDDDNCLDPDYLEHAAMIAARQPWIGCFGGKARAVLESTLAPWKQALLAYLGVRDYGPHAISSTRNQWGEWEPIGAGMVCRRDVAEKFVEWVESMPNAARLGRAGKNLMSGDDTLIAFAAYHLKYACSYQPALQLSHWMKSSRLRSRVLARTLAGHGRSHVILQALKGDPIPRVALWQLPLALMRRYLVRVFSDGFTAGTIVWFWDVGYYREARRES